MTCSSGIAADPLTSMGLFWSADSSIHFGFEHPVLQGLIETAKAKLDVEERWVAIADIELFIWEHRLGFPIYQEARVIPLGAELDTWSFAGVSPSSTFLNNWENAPHRP